MGVETAAMAMMAGAAAGKAGGAVMEGMAQHQKYSAEADKMRVAASDARLRATETDAAFREELSQTLSNLDSITASQNRSIDSPTSIALQERARDVNDRRTTKAVANEERKAMQSEQDAIMLKRAGNRMMLPAYIKAGSELMGASSSAATPKK
jgi:hypothetical protein